MLRRLTDRPRRGPRPVRHVSQDDRLLYSISVQGIYRLAESSAADLEAVLAGPPGEPIPLSRPRKPQAAPAGTEAVAVGEYREPAAAAAGQARPV
jgi:hypothetical protein